MKKLLALCLLLAYSAAAQLISIDGNATGRCDDCAPLVRQVDGQLTFETGALQANGYQADGIYKDGFFIQTIEKDGTARTITNITKSSTPVATYTGTLVTEIQGLTLGDTGGWSEMQGRLIRPKNPTSTTFEVWQDGNDDGYNPTEVIGSTRTSTASYSGSFGADMSAQGWVAFTNDGVALPSDHDVKIVQTTHTPPANDIGSANAVVPLLGDYFLSTQILYYQPHEIIPNNTNNRPRFSGVLGEGQGFACTDEIWFSVSWFLPSNYDHEAPHDGNQSRNQIFLINAKNESGGTNPIEFSLEGRDPETSDYWKILYAVGTKEQSQILIDAGDVVDDVDLWHTFVVQMDMDPTDGILRIWQTTGADLGSGERAMEQILDRTSAGVGTIGGVDGCNLAFRQYKFGWHHSNNTIDSTVHWMGLDELRYGLAANGTRFSDVQPFEQSPP